MPTPSVRHHEVVGSLGPSGFTATRDRRAVTPKPAPKPKARAATRDAGARVPRLVTDTKAATATLERMGDSLDRLADNLRTIAERRRAMRDAGAPSTGIHRFATAAAVQAANAKRWGR